MKLTDLDPRWFTVSEATPQGIADGVTFMCPHCRTVRIGVTFANPVGGGAPRLMTFKEKHHHVHDLRTFDVPPGHLWTRVGETFNDLTLTPSVDASAAGHWHGFVTNGECT